MLKFYLFQVHVTHKRYQDTQIIRTISWSNYSPLQIGHQWHMRVVIIGGEGGTE